MISGIGTTGEDDVRFILIERTQLLGGTNTLHIASLIRRGDLTSFAGQLNFLRGASSSEEGRGRRMKLG